MNIVHNTDCLPAMRAYPDKHFDLAVVDPPYFSGPERRKYYGSEVSTRNVKRREYHVAEAWQVPGAEYFKELERISKRYIVWGCNYYDYVFSPGRIVRDKCNGASTFSNCFVLKDAEGHLLTIDAEYKRPFENWKDCELFRRVSGGGVPYVAVKSGCILRGLIWPYKAVDEQFVEVLGEIYNAAAVSLAASKEEQMKIEEGSET